MPDNDTKAEENKLRRAAARQGLLLRKSKRRDPMATGYGTYMLVRRDGTVYAAGPSGHYGLDMKGVFHALNPTII